MGLDEGITGEMIAGEMGRVLLGDSGEETGRVLLGDSGEETLEEKYSLSQGEYCQWTADQNYL